jgi:autotransporter-associated beta strand protein
LQGLLLNRCVGAVVSVAFFAAIVAEARAQTTAWKGGAGSWNVAANWTNLLPSATRDARIDNLPGTNSIVSLTASGATRNLTVDSNDQLDLAGFPLSVAGTSIANNGVIDASGPIDFATTGTLSGSGTLNATHMISATGLTNAAGHTLSLNSAGETGPFGVVMATSVANHGTLAGGPFSQSEVIADTIANSGTIAANSGSLSLRAPAITHNGTIQTLDNNSVINLNLDAYVGGVTVSGSGSWDITDGGLNAPHPVAIQTTGEFHLGGTGLAALGFGSSLSASVLSGAGSFSSFGFTLTILNGDVERPFSGTLGTSARLIKTGAGTQVINSEQIYSGGTSVEGGTLEINNPNEGGSGVGFGDLNVESGGTLAGIGSSGTFSFVKNGGTVAPGSGGPGQLTFFGLTLEPGSKLELELGNGAPGDFVRAYSGDFIADGVDVKLTDIGMEVGVTTWFLDWTGAATPSSITPSDFTLVSSPDITGTFVVDTANSRVGFQPASLPLQGDYNRNGVVDAADYAVWRKYFNRSVTAGTLADGDGSGFVDDIDYDVWTLSFGNTSLGAGSGVQVPEPSAAVVMSVAFAVAVIWRKRKLLAPSGPTISVALSGLRAHSNKTRGLRPWLLTVAALRLASNFDEPLRASSSPASCRGCR